MRIGIDATCWANDRGYGRYTRELVGAMVPISPAHEFVCILDDRAAERFDLKASNVQPVVVPQSVAPTLAAVSGGRRSVGDMLKLSNAVRKARVDAFFSPSVYGYYPLPPGLPTIVTIHDAIAERFPELTLPSARDRWFWQLKVSLALWQARLILTSSDYGARQVHKYLRVPLSRLRVAPAAVSSEFRPSDRSDVLRAARDAGLPAGARWLMYVGGFGPHKHVDLVVRAHARAAKTLPGSPLFLLLAGSNDGFHDDTAAIRDAIRECGTEHLVRWLGYVPDAELRHLHSGALALMLVSASEGFGLPAVEAASCGTPVIATTESPLPEVLDGGGFFIEPGSIDAIAAAIERLATDEFSRRAMGIRALQRTRALSWTRSAAVVLGALEEVGSARKPRQSVA